MTVLYTRYKAENNALLTIYVVRKSTERFGNLSLEKYGILKWKMGRNPVIPFCLGSVFLFRPIITILCTLTESCDLLNGVYSLINELG